LNLIRGSLDPLGFLLVQGGYFLTICFEPGIIADQPLSFFLKPRHNDAAVRRGKLPGGTNTSPTKSEQGCEVTQMKVSELETTSLLVSDEFFGRVFRNEQGVESLVILDYPAWGRPRRLFLVKYVLGGSGENARPILKNELTGYDSETLFMYPTQFDQLENLQSVLESSMYGQEGAELSTVMLQSRSTGAVNVAKTVISESLVTNLIALYHYAW
jgi:hypothetical protein